VNQFYKNLALWLVISLVMIMLFNMMTQKDRELEPVPYTVFLTAVEEGRVAEVVIQGSNIEGRYTDKTDFKTFAPDDPELISRLTSQGISIEARPDEDRSFWVTMFVSWGPILLLIAVWIFFMRQMQSGGGKAMSFGKSRAKLLNESSAKVTFNDVAGIDEAKDELEEIVSFLKDPKKFSRLGGRIPKGVLLVGSPGTGKTLLARAIAGEAGVPFFSISGSDFVEMFVGVGASRVRDLFVQGKKNAPCIIFIDEIDAVGRHRGAGLGGGNDEREQTLNQLLVEMDGFEANEGIILIAATNRPDVLDPALLRPGRFDRQVVVPRPDIIGREKILKVHVRKVPLAPDVDLRVVARGTPGFSGADLANLVNEAALLAARRSKRLVTHHEFEDAKDKVLMGAERRSMVMTEEEKTLTAYHEGGHALVALHMPASDPVHKATISPRGRALGMVMRLPERDMLSYTRAKLKADITVAMGGRVAEEIVFGYEKVTSGAAADIKMATQLARAMVTQYGMSDKLGPLAYGDNEEEVFLGHSIARTQNLSDETQTMVDEEIHRIVDEAFEGARKIISENIEDLHTIARGLLEYETLSGEEIKNLLKGKPPVREFAAEVSPRPGPASAVPAAGRGKRPPEPEPDTGGMEPQPQT